MTIEQKALELVKRALDYADGAICRHDQGTHRGGSIWTICDTCGAKWADDQGGFKPSPWPELFDEAVEEIRAHESDKSRHAAEMREQAERFSEAVKEVIDRRASPMKLRRFILAPVDPLVDAMSEAMCGIPGEDYTQPAADLRAALYARGLAIVKKEAVNG